MLTEIEKIMQIQLGRKRDGPIAACCCSHQSVSLTLEPMQPTKPIIQIKGVEDCIAHVYLA